MTTENLILKNWRQEQLIFLENLTICRNHPIKRAVHDLRVAIKKMRSYLRLKEELTGEKWKEEFSGILILFKSFGRLRDIEMSVSLIRKEEKRLKISLNNFKKYLIVSRSLVRKWVKQDAVTFNEQQIDGFAKNFDLSYSTEELIEKIIHLSESKIRKTKQLSRHFQKKAHNIRKELKDVFYWLSVCPADMANNVINLKSLDKILDQLGKWQDHFILVKKTNRYIKDFVTDDDEKKVLKELQTSLIKSQDELLDKAKKKWREQ